MTVLRSALLSLAVAASLAAPAGARCIDEDKLDTTAPADEKPAPPLDARLLLADLVRDALARSQAIGASRLLAEAALEDVQEVRAQKQIQATVGGTVGPSAAISGPVHETMPLQVRATIGASQLLYDGGRTDRLVDWRTQLAESARLGTLTQQEQIALNTVSLALERSRYRMQVQVYGQYQRKMACLVEALETIVKADRGRASELVQAKKSQSQAELAIAQTQSALRQVEVKLRRLVGDGLPPVDGLASVLLAVPELAILQDDVLRSAEIAQLEAQAQAAKQYAAAIEAGQKPQVSWNIGGSAAIGGGGNIPPSQNRSAQLAVGVQVNIPLLNPGATYASEAARKRALAASLQRADAIDARRFRVAEAWEQTQSAFDRARRLGGVLRESDQVRNFTLQQWQQMGRRSLFDVMAAESEFYGLRVAHVNALHDGQQLNALLLSLGRGVSAWLQ